MVAKPRRRGVRRVSAVPFGLGFTTLGGGGVNYPGDVNNPILAGVGAWLIDLLIVWTIVGIFVNCALMARKGERNGMTLGKQVLKIRVYREDGQPVGFGLGVLRDFVVRFLLFGLVGFFFLGLPGLLDLLWPLWDERNQTLHDKIVSTYVIRAEQPAPMIATTG